MSMFRRLSLACLLLALAGCQSARVEDSQSQLFQRYLAEGRLAQADQLLDAAAACGVDTERLAPYQRRLADAYLRQGQEALQKGDLATATTALSRARSLLPAAPALTAGLGSDALQPHVRSIMLPLLDKGDHAALAAQLDGLVDELRACDCRMVLETRGNWQSSRALDLLQERLGSDVEVEVSHVTSRVPRLLLIERGAGQ